MTAAVHGTVVTLPSAFVMRLCLLLWCQPASGGVSYLLTICLLAVSARSCTCLLAVPEAHHGLPVGPIPAAACAEWIALFQLLLILQAMAEDSLMQ